MNKLREKGFVLALTILLVLGVSAISVGVLFNGRMGRMSALNYKNKIRTFMATDGMITLLAQELINGNGAKYVDFTRIGSINARLWEGIPGSSVSDFVTLTRTVPPTRFINSLYLGSNRNQSNYGVKWSGWIIPPLTGAYTFITRSDDESRFYLSTDAEQANLSSQPICRIEGWPGWVVDWPTSGQAVSAPVPLEAGRRYYFEYYHKQGNGWDVGQMGWNGPEFFSERPITGQHLSQFKSDPEYSGTTNVGDTPVRFSVGLMGLDAYRISAEAAITKPGNPSDTLFRLPLVQSLSLRGPAIPPAPTMSLPVIYYDYPAGVNPEFNMPLGPPNLGVFTGMVSPTLVDFTATDANYFGLPTIPKPSRGTPAPNWGCGVNEWFRYWPAFAPNTRDYRYATPTDCTLRNARTYTNQRIYANLQFDLNETQGPYTYVYSRMGNMVTGNPQTTNRGEQEFFPLDHLGRDPAFSAHNYSFCMELHTTFLHQSGLKFEFTGDDDVWVFINNRLVIDLGGIHASTNAILTLDDIVGLTYGQTYPLDFFQCERQQFNSTSRIVTNIKMGRPWGAPVGNWHRDYTALY